MEASATHPEDRFLTEPAADVRAWAAAVLLSLSLALNFIARLVLANVAPALEAELHLSNTQYSYIVFSFMTAMMLGQVPAGVMLDWIGARLGLPILLIGWSASNILQSLARGVLSFSGLRFLMGVFECGNQSAAVKVIGGLFPARQTALALAVMDSGSVIGSMVASPLVVFILVHWGWRAAFSLPSLLGFLWLPLWFKFFRPGRSATLQHAAATEHPPGLRAIVRRRKVWGVVLMRAFAGPISQFYWYWLPLYLVRGRGMSFQAMATLSFVAYLLGGLGSLFAGGFSNWLLKHGMSANAVRKLVFAVGTGFAASCAAVPLIPGIRIAIALISLAIFGLNMTGTDLSAIIADIFPEVTLARISGLTGMGEGVMNMILTLTTGIVVDRVGFGPVFAGAGLMPLFSAAALFLVVGHIHRTSFAKPRYA